MILAIARGGLLIGGALGYALSVKNVYTMNVEFYTGVDERLEVPRILPPAPDFVDVHDARILIADDVADTGHTLRSVQDVLRGQGGRGAHRGALREVALGRAVRLRVEAHRPVDQLPVERQGAGHQARLGRPRRLTAAPDDRYARGVPLYEYRCRTCDERFELRRPMSDSDLATPCPEGHDDTCDCCRCSACRPAPPQARHRPASAADAAAARCGCRR